MIEQHDYPVSVRWSSDKKGIATSPDVLPPLEVASPPEFDGHAQIWTPEHLFVASVASCFLTTFLAIAAHSKVELAALEVPAEGRLVRGEDRRYSIARVTLRPRIVLAREQDRDKAARIAAKAEEVCLVTRSIRSQVVAEPTFAVSKELAPLDAG